MIYKVNMEDGVFIDIKKNQESLNTEMPSKKKNNNNNIRANAKS